MSEARSALPGASFHGLVRIEDAGLRGMVTLRADLSAAKVRAAVKKVAGVELPAMRRVTLDGARGALWMSPDELLLLVPHGEAALAVESLSKALAGVHHLAAEVSDARAVFRIEGAAWRDVLAKLTPADLRPGAFAPGEVRRTRLAQVPAAFWMTGAESVELVCFRSLARYVFDLLSNAADPAAPVGHF
jgi:sarcosine oxidase, subunit gamma